MTSAVPWMGQAYGFGALLPWQFPEVTRYWDARTGITESGERVSAWSASIKGSTALEQATGANQPYLLPYAGVNYAWNAGVASNTITCPTTSITGDFVGELDQANADNSPASDVTLCSKLSGNDGFEFILLTTGVLRLRIGDGASVTNVDSTEAVSAANFARATFGWDWEDGVGATFYEDGVQLGDVEVARWSF